MRLKDLSILQYQNVSPRPEQHRLWLSLEAFREQMDHLAGHDYHPLSLDQALEVMQGQAVRAGRPLALTFDNGFSDFGDHAYPLLHEHGFPSTLLVNPLRVGKTLTLGPIRVRYLSWSRLREMTGPGHLTVGAYEDEALNINQIPAAAVKEHVTTYRKRLEDGLGTQVRYFGVKEGVPRRSIRELLKAEGYRAFLTQCPTHRRPDPYAIGRIQVDDPDFNIFLTKISRTYLFFKDRRVWTYIRRYRLDRVGHRLSEGYDRLRGKKNV